ncbi:MAG: hypothetical protein ACLSHC_03560 [Bilophila wadsworthia]
MQAVEEPARRETTNRGGHTNPPDLSSVTYKTVHMRKWARKGLQDVVLP